MKKVVVEMWVECRKRKAVVMTIVSEIENMVIGVTRGYCFKMRACYAYFPMMIEAKEKVVSITSFIGRRERKTIELPSGCTIDNGLKDVKQPFCIAGTDLDKVSLTCAKINQSCKVRDKHKDKFLDGIYIEEKTHLDGIENEF
eukprot:TRINITY_DN7462_c0_g1_i6.p1 TRINITY_DN7462_c0_g1~~TRINITY_DN7462_c0_g1_i6.p1  ORF type:complete len:143 (-),score=19.70 TRINITY_DN7462_c0_g1_i6:142-570(-)